MKKVKKKSPVRKKNSPLMPLPSSFPGIIRPPQLIEGYGPSRKKGK